MKKIVFICIIISILISCKKKEVDIDPPIISLKGCNPVNIQYGTSYDDAGATAWDEKDGDISDKIVITNLVDVNIKGTQYVKYNVTDEAGNKAQEVRRTINVMEF